MDTNIVQILLLLILIQFALGGYYYLLYNEKNKMKKEDELLLQLEEKLNNDTNKCDTLPKGSLPSTCNGFHDKFFKDNNKFLGWRYFYLKNQSNNQIEDDKNFQGTSVRNYLDQLENTKNIITPKRLQIR